MLDSLQHKLWRDSWGDEEVQVERRIGKGSHAVLCYEGVCDVTKIKE
jgi:hypothetical protein